MPIVCIWHSLAECVMAKYGHTVRAMQCKFYRCATETWTTHYFKNMLVFFFFFLGSFRQMAKKNIQITHFCDFIVRLLQKYLEIITSNGKNPAT